MIDFAALDPETRCVALVGEFLRRWSNLETALNSALATAMQLDDTMRAILCANVQLRDKFHILRTIIDVSTMGMDEKKHWSDTLGNISNYSLHRNMMAHQTFGPDDEGKGVRFLLVKAKGKLSQGDEVWVTDRFIDEYKTIDGFIEQLAKLQASLDKSQFSFGNVDWARIGSSEPMRRTMSPALIHLLYHQTPLPLYADQASPEKDPGTPAEPLERPDG
jgi:hypothetical protein